MDINLDYRVTLRIFVSLCFYVVVSYGFVAWKYRVYRRVAKVWRPVLVYAHIFAAASNVVAFPLFMLIDRHQPVTPFLSWFGLLIAVGGALFLIWAGLTLRIATFVPPTAGEITTTGPFRITTHPMYLGGVVVGFGLSMWSASMLGLVYALVVALTLMVVSKEEEKSLVERFGQAYLEYKERAVIKL
ncbi:MAG: isoprenylcysteine carboxylmethyltransferase family protein [Actinobacteria bacterium]|nr:isoprenylcysteine carboxylmethyltransferase family protein [Actinomycetota bacterium]